MPGEFRSWEHNPLEAHICLKLKPDFSLLGWNPYWPFRLGGYRNLPAIHLPCQISLSNASFSQILAKQRSDSVVFSFTWRSWQRFRGVIRGGDTRKQMKIWEKVLEVDVRSFWAGVNFFFLLATCQGLDCKFIFLYSCENAIGFENHSTLAITLLKQNFSCLHISLWHLYSDHFFLSFFWVCLFLFVCLCTSNF